MLYDAEKLFINQYTNNPRPYGGNPSQPTNQPNEETMKRNYRFKHVEDVRNFKELVLALDELQNDYSLASTEKDYDAIIKKLRILKDLHFLWKNEDYRLNNKEKEDKKLTVLYGYIDLWHDDLEEYMYNNF
jgi:hypothetical protein